MNSVGADNKKVENNKNKDLTFVDLEYENNDENTIVEIDSETNDKSIEEQICLFGYLIIRSNEHRGRVFQVKNGTTIGRNEGDIIIRDPQMSREHVRIFVKKGGFYFEDLKTVNKTYVNGKEITKPTQVKQDDVVLIGETEFEFKILHYLKNE